MIFKSACSYVEGKSHKKNNTGCQDRAYCYNNAKGCLAVLADGASTKVKASESAEICCGVINDYFTQESESYNCEELRKTIAFKLNDAFVDEKGFLNTDDFGTTLMFVKVRTDGKYVAGHIGDGAIFLKKNGNWAVMSKPQNGMFSNETYLVPNNYVFEKLRIYTGEIDENSAFILSSDGISDMLCSAEDDSPTNACNIFEQIVGEHSEEESMKILHDELGCFFGQFTNDDMSIAIVVAKAL